MFDVVVIGGGPAGVTAALHARALGATVALVERGNLGGTCTNDGCLPTRVLAHAARLVRDGEQFAAYGLVGEAPTVNFPQVLSRTHDIVYRVHEKKQLRGHLEESGVTVFANAGEARFEDEHALALADGTILHGATCVLSAGGHARRLAFPGSEYALTHSDVWSLTRLPRSVIVVGGAATGCQLASIFAAFGADVHVLEVGQRLLGAEDPAVSSAITAAFARRGIEIITGIDGIERIERQENGLNLAYIRETQPHALSAETVIIAVGWPGNLDALNLAAAHVRTERGYIVVDDSLQTSAPHIFAAGDITGRMMLVQSATGEAEVAAENAVLGMRRTVRHTIVPHGGFTDPEYGSVGLTETQARAAHDCVVALVPYAELDRAVVDGHTDGFCKLIASRETRQVLGAHIVGEQAVEILQVVAAAIAGDISVGQLARMELAYPTFTSIIGIAARELQRQMGEVPVTPRWGTLRRREAQAQDWSVTEA